MAPDLMGQSIAEVGGIATRLRQRRFLTLCTVALLVWLAAVVLLWPAHGTLLNWDEVDYAVAASLGPWANVADRGSLSPLQYGRFAVAKISAKEPVLPADYDESRDLLLLRHYHPPFVVLLLSIVSPWRNERLIRSVQLLGALAFTFATICSYWSLSGSTKWFGMLLVLLLTLWMIPPLFSSLSFHGWEAVWTTTSAALMSRLLNRGMAAIGLLLCVTLALAFLTLETGLLVWVAAILCLVIWRSPALPWRRFAAGAALTMLLVVVVWPGSLFNASLVKIPALYVYRIWLGEEYAGVLGLWPKLVQWLLPMLVLGALACLTLFFMHRGDYRRWGPYVMVGGLYGIAMVRFALAPQYLLPALAPLVSLVGLAADRTSSTRALAVVGLATLILIGSTWPSTVDVPGDRARRTDLQWLGEVLRGRQALVDGGHIYQYYLGQAYAIRPITVSYGGDSLLLRQGGMYRLLDRRDLAGAVLVILKSRQRFFLGRIEGALLGRCSGIDRVTVRVYDCGATGVIGTAGPGGTGPKTESPER